MSSRFHTVFLLLLALALWAPTPRVWAAGSEGGGDMNARNTPTTQTAPADAQLHRRKRIAVVNFEVPRQLLYGWFPHGGVPVNAGSNVSAVLSDMLISALVKTGAFEVIERTELQKLMNEHKLRAEGVLDPETAARAGKVLGVDLLIGGKLTEFGVRTKQNGVLGALTMPLIGVGIDLKKSTARAVVDARVIDATTGRILTATTGTGENSETNLALAGTNFHNFFAAANFNDKEWTNSRIGRATRTAVDDVVTQVLAHFPVEAVVKGVLPDGGIILDLGRFSGINVGDEFQLMQETIFRDAQSGEEIYRDHKEIGAIRVIEVQDDRSKCIAVSTLAIPPRRGDYAVLRIRAEEKVPKHDKEKSSDHDKNL